MSATKPKVINGLSFDISQPYAEGHTLSALEANVLNQVRAENIGNNVRQRIKDMQDGNAEKSIPVASEDEIRAYVASVDAEYVFRSASEGARTSRDPYEVEAKRLARELVKAKLLETGRKIGTPPDGETEESWKDKVEDQINKVASNEKVLAAAKRTVDAKRKQSDALMAVFADVEG